MLFKSEVVTEENEGDDSIVLPQYLKEKIERGEPLDSEELLEYKEIYEKNSKIYMINYFKLSKLKLKKLKKILKAFTKNMKKIYLRLQ